jgi:hypothetical protein
MLDTERPTLNIIANPVVPLMLLLHGTALRGTLNGQPYWSNGFLLELASPPVALTADPALPWDEFAAEHLAEVERHRDPELLPARLGEVVWDATDRPGLELRAEGEYRLINPNAGGYLALRYPDLTWYIGRREGSAVEVRCGERLVAIIMPLRRRNLFDPSVN